MASVPIGADRDPTNEASSRSMSMGCALFEEGSRLGAETPTSTPGRSCVKTPPRVQRHSDFETYGGADHKKARKFGPCNDTDSRVEFSHGLGRFEPTATRWTNDGYFAPSGRCEEPLRMTPSTNERLHAARRTHCVNASHLSGISW
jgi:hypothetical protein